MGSLNLFLFFWATLQKDLPCFPGSAVTNPCVTQLDHITDHRRRIKGRRWQKKRWVVPLFPELGRQPYEARTVVTTYLSQADGLKSDLTETSRYDIAPESSSLKQHR